MDAYVNTTEHITYVDVDLCADMSKLVESTHLDTPTKVDVSRHETLFSMSPAEHHKFYPNLAQTQCFKAKSSC